MSRSSAILIPALLLLCVMLNAQAGIVHEWTVDSQSAITRRLENPTGGVPATFLGNPTLMVGAGFGALEFNGKDTSILVSSDHTKVTLPLKAFSLEVWCRVDSTTGWGGLLSCVQDNGAAETGWVLGTRKDRFAFAVSTTGSDDGDGKMTYLTASSAIQRGKWAHVVGTFNGRVMQLFVNGTSMGSSAAQSGSILYPKKTSLEIAAYHDADEYFRLSGALHSATIYSRALRVREIRRRYDALKGNTPKERKRKTPAITDGETGPAIAKGVSWLMGHQEPDGSWCGNTGGNHLGSTALIAYTLMKCGVPPSHPVIRSAISLLRSKKFTRTYDVACTLMAFSAVHDESLKREMEVYCDYLIDICGNGIRANGARWGYPYAHQTHDETWNDLSNTQYALLGLRAARLAGVKKGNTGFWRRVTSAVAKDAEPYGGWGYRKGRSPTGSMTMAGIGCLIICRDALGRADGRKARDQIKAGITRGLEWMQSHWSVWDNPGGTSRWLYYLYGMERVGSFLDAPELAGHDWHTEGSRELIKKQGKWGEWEGTHINTCFALMFLNRGSRVSGGAKWVRNPVTTAKEGAFEISARSEFPVLAWIKKIDPALRSSSSDPRTLKWLLNGRVSQENSAFSISSFRDTQNFLKATPKANGKIKIQAVIKQKDGDVYSNILEMRIDSVDTDRYQSMRADHGKNLISNRSTAVASSGNAARAIDDWYTTGWVAKPGERYPWIRIVLSQARRANEIKLAQAVGFGGYRSLARAKEISISINGRPHFIGKLLDDSWKAQIFTFPTTLVKSIRIKVLGTYKGVNKDIQIGFKEVQLFLR